MINPMNDRMKWYLRSAGLRFTTSPVSASQAASHPVMNALARAVTSVLANEIAGRFANGFGAGINYNCFGRFGGMLNLSFHILCIEDT